MKNSVKCIIVDDEPKAIELLKDCIGELYSNIEVVSTHTSWNSALQALREQEFDLLLLDISIPGKTGIDLLNLLPGLSAEVIFVTAHSEFALNAFKFAPSGYVLKPLNDQQLSQAIDKALERIQHKKLAKQPPVASISSKIGIPNNKGTDYLNADDILYLEALNNCTKVVTRQGEITSSYNLGKFKTILEKHSFYPVHRSYLVNLNCITRYTANHGVVMVNGDELPVSKNVREDFLLNFEKVSRTD